MAKQLFANGASSTLAVSIVAGDLTVQVQSGYGSLFPSPSGGDWFLVTLEDVDANVEVVKCTARSGDLLTVVRAQEGTSAQSFTNTTTRVELRNTKGTLERMLQRSGDTLGGDLELGGYELSGPGSIGSDVTVPYAAVFDVGMIMLWSGSIGTIPSGWALCDGSNGTPDLRDRFVMGAGSAYAVGATGGAATDTATTGAGGDHDHGAATGSHVLTEAELPAHNHRLYGWNQSSGSNDNCRPLAQASVGLSAVANETYGMVDTNGSSQQLVEDTGSGSGHTHSVAASGTHTHSVSVDTLPPYYALAYIMFTG